VFASLEGDLLLVLARRAFHSQDNLLCGLGLLLEDGLGLTTETGLFAIVSSLTLGEKRGLTSLVLSHLMEAMTLAFAAAAEGVSGFWNVDHFTSFLLFFLIQ